MVDINLSKFKSWIDIIGQTFIIVGIIASVIYWPVSKRFEACEKNEKALQELVSCHLEDHKKKDQHITDLTIELRILNTLLDQVKDELTACKESDTDLRKSLYQFMSKRQ